VEATGKRKGSNARLEAARRRDRKQVRKRRGNELKQRERRRSSWK